MNRTEHKRLKESMGNVLDTVAKRPWVAFVFVAIIGAADFFTGPQLSFGIFYLLPVALLAWYHGVRWVTWIALVCGGVWLLVDLAGNLAHAQQFFPYWNALTRFGIFLAVGLVIHHLRHLQTRQADLLRYVVHDMRDPLMTFTNTLELLERDVGERVSPASRECFGHCRVASRRMRTLIDSILDLARLEAGRMPLHPQDVRVEDLVREAIYETSVFADSKGIELVADVVPAAGCVRADPAISHRILVNLLTNAVKVSPEGSRVRVRADVGVRHEVVIAVDDQGSGVPKEYVSRIFDKFVQIQLRKAGVSSGSGFGLSFCRAATAAQGGRIWVENVADNGASVHVALPAVG